MKNIGIDIVENNRFLSFVENPRKYQRILSAKEKDLFLKISNKSRKLEYLAGRFAAKEAVIKCLAYTDYKACYSEISILNKEGGSPYVEMENENYKILLSISHSNQNTIAVAVLIE